MATGVDLALKICFLKEVCPPGMSEFSPLESSPLPPSTLKTPVSTFWLSDLQVPLLCHFGWAGLSRNFPGLATPSAGILCRGKEEEGESQREGPRLLSLTPSLLQTRRPRTRGSLPRG